MKYAALLKNEFDEAFPKVDLILPSTAPNTSYINLVKKQMIH